MNCLYKLKLTLFYNFLLYLLNKRLGFMMKYEVNVNAAVSGSKSFLESHEFHNGWEVCERLDISDHSIEIRLNTRVHVEASDVPDAISAAIASAPTLELNATEDYVVELWACESVDIAEAC
jgi:hypothetical protein